MYGSDGRDLAMRQRDDVWRDLSQAGTLIRVPSSRTQVIRENFQTRRKQPVEKRCEGGLAPPSGMSWNTRISARGYTSAAVHTCMRQRLKRASTSRMPLEAGSAPKGHSHPGETSAFPLERGDPRRGRASPAFLSGLMPSQSAVQRGAPDSTNSTGRAALPRRTADADRLPPTAAQPPACRDASTLIRCPASAWSTSEVSAFLASVIGTSRIGPRAGGSTR